MPVYNKLVRDLIPQVIEKSGGKFTTRTLDPVGTLNGNQK